MAWFRWRKNTPQVDEQEDAAPVDDVVVPPPAGTVEQEREPSPELPSEPTYDPEPVVEPEPALEPDVEPEPTVEPVAEPEAVPEPALDPEPFPGPDPVTDQLGSTTTLQVAEQIVPSDQPAPVLAWNPGLRGVVVKIVHTAPSAAGSAEDLRAALENGLAAAVGEHSPAPHDADPEYPVVLNVTIAEETVDAEVTEVLASARKQLARKAVRVRLVVDQAPLAEIA